MIPPRSCSSFLLVGCLFAASGAVLPAGAEEMGQVIRVSNRCDVYGPGFVDMGNGYCGRVVIGGPSAANKNARIEQNPQAAGSGSWTIPGSTSNAALRNDGAGMLPGISDAQHLRIQGGADAYAR